jgi:hypothetical protein
VRASARRPGGGSQIWILGPAHLPDRSDRVGRFHAELGHADHLVFEPESKKRFSQTGDKRNYALRWFTEFQSKSQLIAPFHLPISAPSHPHFNIG